MFAVSGCGLLSVEGPPSTIPEDATSARCTESKTLPTIDYVWSGLNVIGSFIILGQHEALKREVESQPRGATSCQLEKSGTYYRTGLSASLQGLLFWLSGNRASKKISACRDAVDMIEMRYR